MVAAIEDSIHPPGESGFPVSRNGRWNVESVPAAPFRPGYNPIGLRTVTRYDYR